MRGVPGIEEERHLYVCVHIFHLPAKTIRSTHSNIPPTRAATGKYIFQHQHKY